MVTILWLLACSEPPPPPVDPRIQQVAHWTQLMMDTWQIPGVAIGILEEGELAWSAGMGVRALGESQPVTPQTRFRIGSLSKMFAAATVLPLADAGLVDLEAPASETLEGVSLQDPDALSTVTVAQLLSHSSGLQSPGLPNTCDVSEDGLADIIAERSPDWVMWAEPEQFFLYSNTGYALAGYAAELAAGEPFAELVDRTVLAPAGLTQTTYFQEAAEESGNFAIGHSLDPSTGALVTQRDFSDRYCGASFPSGGLISTVEDLGRFAEIVLAGGGEGLAPETLDEMSQSGWAFSETSRYGYGIQSSTYSGHPYLLHTGSLGGFQSILWLFPEDDFGVIVLVNSDHYIGDGVAAPWSKPTHRIAEYIVQVFLEDVEISWRQPPSLYPTEEWEERYTGTFVSEAGWGTVEISMEADTLWMELPEEGERKPMLPYSADRFSVPTTGSDGRTYYPVVSFEVEPDQTGTEQTEWLISTSWGIAQRKSQ